MSERRRLAKLRKGPPAGTEKANSQTVDTSKVTQPPTSDQEAFDRIRTERDGQDERDGGFVIQCVAHDDHDPSLRVSLADGKLLVKCRAGCSQDAVIAGLEALHLWPSRPRCVAAPPGSRPDRLPYADAVYEYPDADGSRLRCIVGRINPKNGKRKGFWCCSYWSDGQWRRRHPEHPKPLYRLDKLAASPNAPALIFEGEKKADAAAAMPEFKGFIPTSWMGGSDAVETADWSPVNGRDAIIFPDNDHAGFDAAATVARCCLEAGAKSVRIVQLPEGLPEKWDIADPVPVGVEVDFAALIREAKTWEPSLAADDPLNRYTWVTLPKCFFDMVLRQFLDQKQLDNETGHIFKKPPLSYRLIGSAGTKKVRGATYWPGRGAFVKEDGYEKLNTWLPETTRPREGPVDVLLDHVNFLVPSATERNYALQWMAYQLQHPGEKIHWALLIVGARQGSGKSTIFQIMRRLLGAHNTKDISGNKQIWQYTGWMQAVQLVAVEEVKSGNRWEEANRIKSFITAPTIFITEKYVVGFEQPNRVNFFLSSNFEDEAMPLEDHDRRFLVLGAPDEVREPEYYARLYAWIDDPANIAAMKHYLLNYDLTDFPAKSPAPMTAAKERLLRSSKTQAEQFLRTAFEEEKWPLAKDIIHLGDLEKVLSYEHRKHLGPNRLGEIMSRMGGKKLSSQVQVADGSKPWLWIIRNHDKWAKVTNAEIGRKYDAPVEGGIYASALNAHGLEARRARDTGSF